MSYRYKLKEHEFKPYKEKSMATDQLRARTPEKVQHDGRPCQLRVLTREVLVVATHTVGGWKAYIGLVAGKNHSQEWPEVLKYGDTLAEDVARFLFEDFAGEPYDR